jgi:hypothetical protein
MSLKIEEYQKNNQNKYFKKFKKNYKCNRFEDYITELFKQYSDHYQKGVLVYNNSNLLGLIKL